MSCYSKADSGMGIFLTKESNYKWEVHIRHAVAKLIQYQINYLSENASNFYINLEKYIFCVTRSI